MTDWTTLCAKFTPQEMIQIIDFQKDFGLNTSQMLRRSLIAVITLFKIQNLVGKDSPYMQFLTPVVTAIAEEIDEKRIESKVNEISQTVDPKLLKELDKEIAILQENLAYFQKHAKRGAPKKKTGKRGRPSKKDTSL